MTDFFEVFELPRRLTLDTEELQRRFYDKSRLHHPDRFGNADAAQQQRSLDLTSALNDGYRTLRDPVRRAEHLLSLEGYPIGEQRTSNVPPELLEEVFELNMMLEDASHNHDELEQARQRFAAMLHRVDCDLEHEFEHYDSGPHASTLNVIRGILNRRRYIQNLLRDVEKALVPVA